MVVKKRKTGPQVRVFRYVQDIDSKIYHLTEGDLSFQKVPRELFLESIRHPETIKADIFIRGRERAGDRYKFQTGLRQVELSKIFYGDHYVIKNEKKFNSFLLVELNVTTECKSLNDIKEFTLHYFNNYKLFPRHRAEFITKYLSDQH